MKMVSRNHQVIKKGAAAVGVLHFTHLIRARIFLASPVRWLENMCELILNLLNLLYIGSTVLKCPRLEISSFDL